MSYELEVSKIVRVSSYLVALNGFFFHTLTNMQIFGICGPRHVFSIQETKEFHHLIAHRVKKFFVGNLLLGILILISPHSLTGKKSSLLFPLHLLYPTPDLRSPYCHFSSGE